MYFDVVSLHVTVFIRLLMHVFMVSWRTLQFMRFSAAEVLPLCQEHSHDSFFNDDWRQMTKRGNFNQRKSWHVIRKRNQHSF